MDNIRPMTPADIPRVAEIHVISRRTAYRGIISDSRLFSETTVHGQIPKFAERLADDTYTTVVYDDGLLWAFMTMCACRDEDKPTAYEVRSIYVDPVRTSHGIGTQLLAYCYDTAKILGHDEICLWVLKENHAARAFYEKMGYTPDGATRDENSSKPVKLRYCRSIS